MNKEQKTMKKVIKRRVKKVGKIIQFKESALARIRKINKK